MSVFFVDVGARCHLFLDTLTWVPLIERLSDILVQMID